MEITRGKIEKAQRVIVYGPEGIGKTTFAAQFPNPVFIDTERSTNHIDVARTPEPTSWPMLLGFVDEFIKDRQGFNTLVVDTADWAERLCYECVLAKDGKSSIEDFGYGIGWKKLREEFCRLLDKLTTLTDTGMNVVLTAHSHLRKFTCPEEAGSYDRYELKLDGGNSAKTKEWADLVLFSNYKTYVVEEANGKKKGEGGKRVMYTSHSPVWDAKNRVGLAEEVGFDYKEIAAHIPVLGKQKPVAVKKEVIKDTPPAEYKTEEMKVPASNVAFNSKLYDLMKEADITAEEIQAAVATQGVFPESTPIDNYPEEFVQGCLIAGWENVKKAINDKKGDK